MSEFRHIPVLLGECIDGLNIHPEGTYVDCTLGGAGHSKEIVKRLTVGKLIANDLDTEALNAAQRILQDYQDKVEYVHGNYKSLPSYLNERGIRPDGILIDLGVSSYQLDTAERGFSYMKDAPLDMRMDQEQEFSAFDVVNGYDEENLNRIFREYGEEKLAYKMVKAILNRRKSSPIRSTKELADIAIGVYPKSYRGGHPAKRIFQAVRIEVNGELEGLDECVRDLALCLKPGGRIAVITFHSLEDRIVKNVFRDLETDCICDKRLPVCVCGKKREIILINKKPMVASEEEKQQNKRSESAKLRIAERV